METNRNLKVFLCHASNDKEIVRTLYNRLLQDGIDVWLDDEKLLPGQKWEIEIPKAVKDADIVIVCLSRNSITKEGYVQKEIKYALDFADEKPENTIYLIPAKLEECDIPSQLTGWQWVDLFQNKESFIEAGYSKLFRSLQMRAEDIGVLQPKQIAFSRTGVVKDESVSQVFRFSDLALDVGSRLASRGDRSIYLPKTEYQLLKLFMEHPNKVLAHKFILENAWDNKLETDSNIIEVYVRYLHQKLEANGEPRLIQTVRGMGYVLREDS